MPDRADADLEVAGRAHDPRNQVIFACKACDATLTHDLQPIVAAEWNAWAAARKWEEQWQDERALLPPGRYARFDATFMHQVLGDEKRPLVEGLVVPVSAMIGEEDAFVYEVMGCCGYMPKGEHGARKPNAFCSCGAALGEWWSDCLAPDFVRLDDDAIKWLTGDSVAQRERSHRPR